MGTGKSLANRILLPTEIDMYNERTTNINLNIDMEIKKKLNCDEY